MKIDTEFESKKGKSELDILSYKNVLNHKTKYCRSNPLNDEDLRAYLTELMFYMEVRFYKKKYDLFEKWVQEVKDGSDDKALLFMYPILKTKKGRDMMYFTGL
ncbi:MAG TPA: hypothetical protein VNX68_11290, partial [Nitrosopumilaceae archaeon]|nr:hypothetical protein [Nitrosopumilaceae archaeon]